MKVYLGTHLNAEASQSPLDVLRGEQAAVNQQEPPGPTSPSGGRRTEPYRCSSRFSRHPVLSWVSLTNTKSTVSVAEPQTATPELKRDESCTHSVTFESRRTSIPLEEESWRVKQRVQVLTNQTLAKINREKAQLTLAPAAPGIPGRP